MRELKLNNIRYKSTDCYCVSTGRDGTKFVKASCEFCEGFGFISVPVELESLNLEENMHQNSSYYGSDYLASLCSDLNNLNKELEKLIQKIKDTEAKIEKAKE